MVPRDEEAEEEERKRRKLQEKEEVKAGKERKRKAERDAKAEAKDAERVCYYATHASSAYGPALESPPLLLGWPAYNTCHARRSSSTASKLSARVVLVLFL